MRPSPANPNRGPRAAIYLSRPPQNVVERTPYVSPRRTQNYWHYSRSWPWWQQRAFLVPAGIAFIVAANMMEEPGIKTTLMVRAAGYRAVQAAGAERRMGWGAQLAD